MVKGVDAKGGHQPWRLGEVASHQEAKYVERWPNTTSA
jgi:hypothetical protein